ncbi:MAG TPA: OmpA family protein [Puia sp.]|jgi:OOP family OmpA-OmpF porin|nr:OmpA family protein [Puia sp.]
MLKKSFFLLLFVLSLSLSGLLAQDANYIQQPSLGLHFVLNSFTYHDTSQAFRNQGRSRLGIAINYLQGLTPHTDLNATISGSFLDYPGKDGTTNNKHLLTEADLALREKLYPAARRFNPFVQGGIGLSRFLSSYGVFLPVGIGTQLNLKGETFLLLNAQYRIPVSSSQSGHFYFSVGIAGIIGRKKIAKTRRKNDGLSVPLSIPSLPPLHPDPKDSDGDGIPDSVDKCPTIAGLASYQGCPAPASSARPARITHTVSDDLRKKIDRAARLVFFETDSATLLPDSYKALNEVVSILQQDTLLLLDISGHTDNSGSAEKNQRLSQRRAKAVLDYLVSQGHLDQKRLSATGYGSSQPIDDNNTPKGRARNRRVQFSLRY